MKSIKEIVIGSYPFFNTYKDYKSKDRDVLCIMDIYTLKNIGFRFESKGNDYFLYPNLTKEEFIEHTLNSNLPMKVGKFLVKEFIDYLGLTIEDLKKFKELINNIDDKHKYELIIYNSYIENNSFILTEEQRNKAYQTYKLYRYGKNI